jgi:hypothetical protein
MEKANANPKNVTKKKFNFQSFLGGKKKKEKKRNDTKIGSRGGYSFAISNSLLYAPMSIYLYVCMRAQASGPEMCFLFSARFHFCVLHPLVPPPSHSSVSFSNKHTETEKRGKKK